MVEDRLTVGIVCHNGEKSILGLIDSIPNASSFPIDRIVIVDVASTDQSVALVKAKYPAIEIIELEENLGPNPARNAILRASRTGLVLLLDHDMLLPRHCLDPLLDAITEADDVGVCSPRVSYPDRPDRIQYNGAFIHYVGAVVSNRSDGTVAVSAVGGGAMLVVRKIAFEVGLFDEDYFLGWEDGDFAFRVAIAGYKVLNVPRSIVYHCKEERGLRNLSYQLRNRWVFMFKTFDGKTILLAVPVLAIYEMGLAGFVLAKGRPLVYWKALGSFLRMTPSLLRKRRQILASKKVADRYTLCGDPIDMVGDFPRGLVVRGLLASVNAIFSFYWRFMKLAL
jgi:GT2 family glycosyltransferase